MGKNIYIEKKSFKTVLYFILLVQILLIQIFCEKKPDNEEADILAKAGDKIITVEDFMNRVELAVKPAVMGKNENDKKQEYLDLLIAEKLLAAEAEKRGMDKSPVYKDYIEYISNKAVIKELYREDIQKQVSLTEEELYDAYLKMNRELTVRIFNTRDPEKVSRFKELLKKGVSFTGACSEIQEIPVDSAQLETVFKWGDIDYQVETEAYKLKPGGVSPVISTYKGFYVVKLIDIRENVLPNESGYISKKSAIKKRLKVLKETDLSIKYVQDFMNRQNAVLKGRTFQKVAGILEKYIDFSGRRKQKVHPELQILNNDEYERFSEDLNDIRHEKLVEFDGGSWTVEKAVRKLRVIDYPFEKTSRKNFKVSLSNVIKYMVRDELLAKKGYEKNLQERISVKNEIAMWGDNFLFNILKTDLNKIDLISLLKDKRAEGGIYINKDKLEKINIGKIQMLAVNPGYVTSFTVPQWPLLNK